MCYKKRVYFALLIFHEYTVNKNVWIVGFSHNGFLHEVEKKSTINFLSSFQQLTWKYCDLIVLISSAISVILIKYKKVKKDFSSFMKITD